MKEALNGGGAGMNSNWGDRSSPNTEVRECDKKLCTGCRINDMDMVRSALKDGADPKVQFRLALGEVTPIFICASKGHKEIAELLIEQHADVVRDVMTFDGTTCLHHAASNHQVEMCQLFIDHGADVNQKDKLGRTALMDAAEIGSVEVINMLINKGARVNEQDLEKHAAVSYSLDFISKDDQKFFEASRLLIERGTDANFAGKFTNRTLLHYAAAQGNLELVRSLIEEKGADPSMRDEQEKTAFDYAEDGKATEVAEYLKSVQMAGNGCCCVVL